MKLALDYYPFLDLYHSGPKVFLNRLSKSIKKNNLCEIKTPFLPFFDIGLYSVYEKNFFNKKFVLRVDGIYFDKQNKFGDTKILNKRIFDSINKASGIIFISHFSKKMVESFHEKIQKPNIIIHNKVPLNIFNKNGHNYRNKLGIGKNDKVLITSAHWRRHKRLNETIKLINIMNEPGDQYKLIILGGKKKNNNQNPNIFFIGEVKPNELSAWYRTADIYIHLAWIEPCGNTQIEAMASGLPVVCCNNGGIGETIKEARGGIVSNCDNHFTPKLLDYYNPPEPDYNKLINAINEIFENLSKYKNSINNEYLDIDLGAKLYCRFIESINNEKAY